MLTKKCFWTCSLAFTAILLVLAPRTLGAQIDEQWILIQNASQGYALYVPPSATVRQYDPEGILHIELPVEHQVLTVRVYDNPARLSAKQWANSQFPNGAMRINDELGPALPIINHDRTNIGERLAETFVLVGPMSLYQQVVLVNVDWAYLISYPVGYTQNESLFEQIIATFEIGDFAENSGFQVLETDSTQTITSLSVPYYSQKNPQWICDQLGTCNCDFATCTTQTYTGIGDAGCFISSQAMIFEYYTANHFKNPREFDTCLTNHGGYGSWTGCAHGLCGASYSPPSLCSPSSVSYEGYSTNLAVLDDDLSNGYPAIAWVDGGVHYVVVTGKSGGMYQINDPYYSRSEISPGEILHFVRYHGSVSPSVPNWDFRNGLEGWTIGARLSNPTQKPQGMWFHVDADDPYLVGPAINVSASSYSHLYLRMASQTDDCGQVFFRRRGDADFPGQQYVNVPIVADGYTHSYLIDMSRHSLWTGNIIQLRLDPACIATGDQAVRIDQLMVATPSHLPLIYK